MSQIIKKRQVCGAAGRRKRSVDLQHLKEGASKSKNCCNQGDKEGSQMYNYVWEGDGLFLDITNEETN